jgi:hypothetical protein
MRSSLFTGGHSPPLLPVPTEVAVLQCCARHLGRLGLRRVLSIGSSNWLVPTGPWNDETGMTGTDDWNTEERDKSNAVALQHAESLVCLCKEVMWSSHPKQTVWRALSGVPRYIHSNPG